jgi:hypothetical protein
MLLYRCVDQAYANILLFHWFHNGMITAVMVIKVLSKVLSIGDNVKKAELRKSKSEDSDSNDCLDSFSMFKDVTSQAVALVALGSYVEDLGV